MSSPHITLWDGKEYDCEMLRAQYPELLGYAQRNSTLQDVTPCEARGVEDQRLFVPLLVFIWIVASLAVSVVPQKNPIYALGFVVASLVLLMLALLSRKLLSLLNDRIEVSKGVVHLHFGTLLRKRSASLRDCHWYLGPISDCPRNRQSIHDQAVLIVFPRRWFWRKPIRFACGWTEETRIVWQQFLQLAIVPVMKN